ncbi:MAG: phosphohistidine phosphatase SixA [Methanomicrobiales archaeon]|nr:phosphohistidine phosphatase SixA [Methanomicrobiales archaeon]
MDLYLLRHGKADAAGTGADDARALTAEGRKEIRRVATWIGSRQIPFSLLASSPLLRARETAELMQAALDPRPSLEVWDELAPDSVMEDLVVRIARTDPAGALLLVGHEPLLSMLASRIIAGDDRARLTLAKGGVAKIREVRFGNGITGELHWLLTPRQIRWMR